MGFFSAIVLSPLAPVRGVIWLGNVIQRQVDQQLHDPATTRRQLEALQEARERGEITAEQERQAQQQILQARMAPKSR
jgi:gas vesicle protein GvpG